MRCPAGYEGINIECEGDACSAPTCTKCSVGFFKPEPGNFPCGPCPENTTTAGNGTISQEQCNIGLLIVYIPFINDKVDRLTKGTVSLVYITDEKSDIGKYSQSHRLK